jgi:hypothetical protein
MLSDFLIAPSLHSLFVTGLLIFIILVLFISNYKQFNRLEYYRKITILSLLTIAFGIHGLIHLGVEMNYGFNPYRWFYGRALTSKREC